MFTLNSDPSILHAYFSFIFYCQNRILCQWNWLTVTDPLRFMKLCLTHNINGKSNNNFATIETYVFSIVHRKLSLFIASKTYWQWNFQSLYFLCKISHMYFRTVMKKIYNYCIFINTTKIISIQLVILYVRKDENFNFSRN